MVTRTMLAVDRFVTVLVALVLIVGGLAAVWWWSGASITQLGGTLPATSDTGRATDVVDREWYPYAAALAGVLLVLVGLWWMARHLNRASVGRLTLGGSDTTGRLQVSASHAAGAAANALAGTAGVRSADGVVVRDRGQLVARLSAVLDPEADLGAVARRCDEVSSQLRQVLERDDLRCRVELSAGRRRR